MDAYGELASQARQDGMNVDETARSLLAASASPVDAIKAIRTAFGMTSGEAKVVVHRNLPGTEQAAAERLWSEAQAALEHEA